MIPILVIMVLISVPLALLGAYPYTYTQEPIIHFSKGSDTPGYSTISGHGNDFVGLLGTITLDYSNNPTTLKMPAVLYTNNVGSLRCKGPRMGGGTGNFGFYITAVTYINNSSSASYRSQMTQRVVLLTNGATVSNISNLKVEFYLISWESSSAFVPGQNYTLFHGTIGTFNVADSSENNIWYDTDYILLEGQTMNPNTNEPTTTNPIVGSGPSSTLPNTVPYVNDDYPQQVLQYQLSIINRTQIDLFNAYGTLKTKVADAQVTMVNGRSNDTYKVNINFNSSSIVLGEFNLHLDGNTNLYEIPYNLTFNGTPVVPGDNLLWDQISPSTPSVKPIYVTGIIQGKAESAPSGIYSDTITVTIIPIDTL